VPARPSAVSALEKGKAVGNEEGKALGSGFFYVMRKGNVFSREFGASDRRFDINVGRTVCGGRGGLWELS
jgi:hypothetical protein